MSNPSAFCANCGATILPPGTFCSSCGQRVNPPATSRRITQPLTDDSVVVPVNAPTRVAADPPAYRPVEVRERTSGTWSAVQQRNQSVARSFPDIRVSRGFLIAVVVCFLLSFVTVSCGPQEVSVSGFQLVTGMDYRGRIFEPVREAVFAFVFTAAALGFSFLRERFRGITSAISSALGFIALLVLKSRLEYEALQSGAIVQVTFETGFWLSTLFLAGATAVSSWLTAQGSPTSTPRDASG